MKADIKKIKEQVDFIHTIVCFWFVGHLLVGLVTLVILIIGLIK